MDMLGRAAQALASHNQIQGKSFFQEFVCEGRISYKK